MALVGNNMDIPKTFNEAMHAVLSEATHIMGTKRALRGTANIERQGLPGIINRIGEDKMSRIQKSVADRQFWSLVGQRPWAQKTLSAAGWSEDSTPDARADETLEDDLLDVLNYCLIAITLERGWWSLPG